MPDPREGLSSEEAERRIRHFGLNELPEKEENACLKFIGFFTGPMAIMICASRSPVHARMLSASLSRP